MKLKAEPTIFWYDALVRAPNGVHRVFYASQQPRIGATCPGIAQPNEIIGYKRYSPQMP